MNLSRQRILKLGVLIAVLFNMVSCDRCKSEKQHIIENKTNPFTQSIMDAAKKEKEAFHCRYDWECEAIGKIPECFSGTDTSIIIKFKDSTFKSYNYAYVSDAYPEIRSVVLSRDYEGEPDIVFLSLNTKKEFKLSALPIWNEKMTKFICSGGDKGSNLIQIWGIHQKYEIRKEYESRMIGWLPGDAAWHKNFSVSFPRIFTDDGNYYVKGKATLSFDNGKWSLIEETGRRIDL